MERYVHFLPLELRHGVKLMEAMGFVHRVRGQLHSAIDLETAHTHLRLGMLTLTETDQPWTGLVYCNGTSNQWVACEEKAKEPTITSADACWCPEEDRTVAFEDAKSLTPVASLPTALGGVVDFEKDFYPTDKTLTGGQPDQTSDGSNTDGAGSPTGSGSVPDSTSAPSNDGGGSGSSSGLGKGAKIGIGVGVAAAVLFILAALAFFFMRRRKQQRDNPSENLTGSLDDPKQDLTGMGVTPDTPATSVPSELESRAARPWSMRSELQTPDTPLSIADRAEADSLATGDKNGHQFQGQNTLRPTDVPAVLRPGPPPGAGAGTQAQGPLSPVAELPG